MKNSLNFQSFNVQKNVIKKTHHSVFFLSNFLDYITAMRHIILVYHFWWLLSFRISTSNQNITMLLVYSALRVYHHNKKSWSNRNWGMSYYSESSIELDFFSIQIKNFFNCFPHLCKFIRFTKFLRKNTYFGVLVRASMSF